MEAPKPITLFNDKNIKLKSFEKDNYKIDIGKSQLNQTIIIKVSYINEIISMENKYSYDELIKLIKPLRINGNIEELYSNLIELFNNNLYLIKDIENEEKLEIILSIYNNKGIKENYSLFLEPNIEDFSKNKKLIIKKVIEIENVNKKLVEENKKLNEKYNRINEEIIKIKKDIEIINNAIFFKEKNISDKLFYISSKIITHKQEINFILNKIEKQSSKKIKELKLLYRASENEGSSTLFHKKCDGITPTITIIHSKNNYKFGGYTEISWSDQTGCDDNAFCFSIDLKKIYNIKKGKRAIAGGITNGPIFYGDSYNFIQIDENAFVDRGHHSCDKKSNYEGVEKDFEICGGVEFFQITDYEVFQIIFN